jgi:hypothetical protein
VHEDRAKVPRDHCQISCSQGVDRQGFLGFAFAILDVMHRGGVHNRLGPNSFQRSSDRLSIGNINLRMRQSANSIPIIRKSDNQIAAKLSIRTDYGNLHG